MITLESRVKSRVMEMASAGTYKSEIVKILKTEFSEVSSDQLNKWINDLIL